MSTNWDVIVIGAGSAGLPAAIFAAQRGARVLQIEADNRIGGTLHWSSGQISAAGTSMQKAAGIDDTPDDHYEDAQRITDNTIDPVLGRVAIDNAADTIEWLLEIGFEMAPGTPAPGVTHEPYRTRRYYWGNNVALSILEVVKPVYEALVAEGAIDLRLQTKLVNLVQDSSGAVIGVEVETASGDRETHHGANIVLTSGGYAANAEMWQKRTPNIPLRSYCNPFSRGDGIRTAERAGAIVDGEDMFLCTFAGWLEEPGNPLSAKFYGLAPRNRLPWEIYVDANGKRFVREDHPHIDDLENALLEQPDMRMFIVFDKGIAQNAPPLSIQKTPEELEAMWGKHPDFMQADTLAELAGLMGVDAANLEQTVRDYNQAVDADRDQAFGREFLMRRIEIPPFRAAGAGGVTVCSPAGLKADAELRVLRGDGSPIPNLYAAGEIFGFGRLSGNAFVGGMSLTPAMTFGRLLGDRLLQWEEPQAATG